MLSRPMKWAIPKLTRTLDIEVCSGFEANSICCLVLDVLKLDPGKLENAVFNFVKLID